MGTSCDVQIVCCQMFSEFNVKDYRMPLFFFLSFFREASIPFSAKIVVGIPVRVVKLKVFLANRVLAFRGYLLTF